MSEPVQIPPESPTVVKSVIDLHMSVHGYSVEQLCKMTLANMTDFMRQWIPSEPEVNRTPLRIIR